ncbi:hypothetical protein KFE25_011508 [Diacronema lutheri]|uniref:EF-hand domain-containing protein n=1 Tax=Diacronema lutheri TaxID=2081491 RepID=A0A8J5XDZ0_DIALT|nr:hypothetical protein KFE25_011508 [Diacronema lutheri]
MPRQDLGELAAQTKSLGLRHGVASYALLTTPLSASPVLRLSAALDSRLAEMDHPRARDGDGDGDGDDDAEGARGRDSDISHDDVGLMQLWTDAFAELVVQARSASAEWAHLLERVYRFFTTTLAAMLRALQAANVAALEARAARAEADRVDALAALHRLRRAHSDLLLEQPSAIQSDDSRNARILAFIDNAPGEHSRRAALAAVLSSVKRDELAALIADGFGENARVDVVLALLASVGESSRATALAALVDAQADGARAMALGRMIRALHAREWAALLPAVAKSLPPSDGVAWMLEIGNGLEPHQVAKVVESLVRGSRLLRVSSTVLAPIVIELLNVVEPEVLIELLLQAIRSWEPAVRAELLAEMTESDAHAWSLQIVTARDKATADAAAAANLSTLDRLRAANRQRELARADSGSTPALGVADASAGGGDTGGVTVGAYTGERDDVDYWKPPLPLLVTLEPESTTTTTRDWAELLTNVVAAAPAQARGVALGADLASADAEATPSILHRAIDAWGGRRAALHIAQLYRLLNEPDRLDCLTRMSERWGGGELRLAAVQLRHVERPARARLGSGERSALARAASKPVLGVGGALPGQGAPLRAGGAAAVYGEDNDDEYGTDANELRAQADAAGGLLPAPSRAARLEGIEPDAQVWLRLPPEWARLTWAGEALATELSLRKTLQLIAVLIEARALAGDSLPAEQHSSFPAFVWRWMVRTHGKRSHALANVSDLLLSVQTHFRLHARVRIFAQLAGLLGEAATAEAFAIVRKAYSTAYATHELSDAMSGDALIDAKLDAVAVTAATTSALEMAEAMDDENDELASMSAERRVALLANADDDALTAGSHGAYALVDAPTLLVQMDLPLSLESQISIWIGKRLEKGPAAEPLDAMLTRFESTGAERALHPPEGVRRTPTKVPALAIDDLVEMLLRAHLALRREEARPLRDLYIATDLKGDGVFSVDEFSQLVQRALKLSAAKRSVSADETESLFLEALRETRMHDPAMPDDCISPLAWELVATRHALVLGSAEGMGLVLAPPLVERPPALPVQPAFAHAAQKDAAQGRRKAETGAARKQETGARERERERDPERENSGRAPEALPAAAGRLPSQQPPSGAAMLSALSGAATSGAATPSASQGGREPSGTRRARSDGV